MKVTIDIDCTPEEARSFLGLPDVAPLQATLMQEIEERMRATLRSTDPEVLFKTWLPASLQGWEQIQAFWRGMASSGKAGGAKPGPGQGKE
jgi:hypothetical protein